MEQRQASRGPVTAASASVVVLAMILAALAMWTVVPFGWLWIASQVTKTQAPSMGPYMLVLAGVIASIVLLGWILIRLNRLYVRITGSHTIGPIRPNWLKSMRDEGAASAPNVLEVVIVLSVLLAGVAMGVWFFLIAGSPIPSQ
jgi:hypothetical protein